MVGHVVGVGIVAVLTLWCARPPRHPRWLATTVYKIIVAHNEAPIVLLVLLTASTVHSISSSDLLSSSAGQAVFVVSLIPAGVLARLQYRTRLARQVIERSVGMPADSSPSHWSLLFPWPRWPRSVERISNLSYGPGGRRHLLDLYRRRDLERPAPVLIYLHGGGYYSGSKRHESRALKLRMAERGWVVLSANYGLRPDVGFPEHLVDAKRVVAWARQSAAEYGMDPSTVVMAGSSAGAHMAALTALSPREKAFQPGFEEVDTQIAAAVCLYGYYGRYYERGPDEWPQSTPFGYAGDNAPPMLIVHGDVDNYTPVEAARDLAEHLRETSPSPVAHAELPGAQHGFDLFASPRFRAVLDGIDAFLTREVLQQDNHIQR